MRHILIPALLVALAATGGAAEAAAGRRGAVLAGEDGRPVAGVRLAKADVQVVVRGPAARTVLTLTFDNDQNLLLGGELVFPLPEGATVSGYALDVDGTMVDGVAVDKQRARVIYETEMRKKVDPGLVEQAGGGAFRTRLYPVPANGSRTVRIAYLSEVNPAADGGPALLTVPMPWEGELDECAIRVDVDAGTTEVGAGDVGAAAPVVRRSPLPDATVGRSANGWVIEATARGAEVGEDLAVELPGLSGRAATVSRRPGVVPAEHYFVVRDAPPVPARPAPADRPAAGPRRIGVLWDASLSRGGADRSRELELLERVCARLGDARVDLLVFRDAVEPPVAFDVRGGLAGMLLDHLRTLAYDGGTNLGAVAATGDAAGGSGIAREFFLLFSDGVGSVGAATPARLEVPVYPVSDDARADHGLLADLARRSGGAHLDLKQTSVADASAAAGAAPYRLISVDFDPAKVADVTPAGGQLVRGGRVTVRGRLTASVATVALNYGFGTKVDHRQTFTLRSDAAAKDDVVPLGWAQSRVAELSVDPAANRAALVDLGHRFGLVTPHTSLLVLETVDQYVRHRVTPPESRPAFHEEYLARAKVWQADEARDHDAKLAYALALWGQRLTWYETDWGVFAAEQAVLDKIEAEADRRDAFDREVAARGGRDLRLRGTNDRRGETDDGGSRGGGSGRGGGQGLFSSGGRSGGGRAADAGNDSGLRPAPGGPIATIPPPARAGSAAAAAPTAVAQIAPWDPRSPYLAALRRAGPARAYDAYLEQRATFGDAPAFYVDCADHFLQLGQRALGVRVLTSVAELRPDDPRVLRICARSLQQVGALDLAVELFERVAELRPEEPQSFRDLALALGDRADARVAAAGTSARTSGGVAGAAVADYARAVGLLNKVVVESWDRFAGIEVVALMEANRIVARARPLPGGRAVADPLDARLVRNLDLDVRVVLTWDADVTGVDLLVTEPGGGEPEGGGHVTANGGLTSVTVGQGYGPQEYCLRRLKPGEYTLRARFAGGRQQEPTGPITVQATVITNFGRPAERRQQLTARVRDAREVVDLGTVRLGR